MSFGFGVGDIASAIQLAWTVYKSCKDAPESFEHLSNDVNSLHATLKIASEELSPEKFPKERAEGLKTILHGCNAVLVDIQKLLRRYESLKTQSKRMWDRWGFGSKDVEGLRSRLTAQMSILSVFINTHSLPHLQRKLDRLAAEHRSGKYEGSTISRQTIESLNQSDQRIWRDIRRDLESVGITVACLEANRKFVIDWFAEAVACGKLDEQPPMHLSNDSQKKTENFEHVSEIVAVDNQPSSPKATLISAAQNGDVSKVRTILEDEDGMISADTMTLKIALYEAAASNNVEITKLLLARGAPIESIESGAYHPLPKAALEGCTETVQLLLDKGADVNARNDFGETALVTAVMCNHFKIGQLLLSKGANPNVEGLFDEMIPLVNAAKHCRTEPFLESLLSSGAYIDAKDELGATALMRAAEYSRFDNMRTLLMHGAKLNERNKKGVTALGILMDKLGSNSNHPAIMMLRRYGAEE